MTLPWVLPFVVGGSPTEPPTEPPGTPSASSDAACATCGHFERHHLTKQLGGCYHIMDDEVPLQDCLCEEFVP